MIRPGRRASPQRCRDNEELFSQNGIAGLSDDYRLGDLRKGKRKRDDLCATVASVNPEIHPSAVASVVSNLMRLADEMKIGDWVLCPSRIAKVYRVGIVDSAYRFDAKAAFQHVRDVRWIGEVAKESLSVEAQRELGAARLFFECNRSSDEVASLIKPLFGAQ